MLAELTHPSQSSPASLIAVNSADFERIDQPYGPQIDQLCSALAEAAPQWRSVNDWPAQSLTACARAGVYRWLLPTDCGGAGWNEADQVRGYLRLAAVDMTTTFIITQLIGACRRIAASDQRAAAQRWLPELIRGDAFATVGISHLTTSRRHLGKPVLKATNDSDGHWRLNGFAPWVTGAPHADVVVVAATTDDGRELLAAVPARSPGVTAGAGVPLLALSASCTDRLTLDDVRIEPEMVLAGPMHDVMSGGSGAGTGGLQTTTLAIGLAQAAADYLQQEAARRSDLATVADSLGDQVKALRQQLIEAAQGAACDPGQLRGDANGLVMRVTQAAMTAAKGAGFVEGHPVGRWCREALFFLVWSCPQPVLNDHLCQLAGLQQATMPGSHQES